MKRAAPMIFVAALAIAAGARGQEAIPTAANAPSAGAPVPSMGPPISLSNKDDRDDGGPARMGPCGPLAPTPDGGPAKGDHQPHGAVWGGVGAHGYREAGGVVCQPLGKDGSVTIAIDSTQWGHH